MQWTLKGDAMETGLSATLPPFQFQRRPEKKEERVIRRAFEELPMRLSCPVIRLGAGAEDSSAFPGVRIRPDMVPDFLRAILATASLPAAEELHVGEAD